MEEPPPPAMVAVLMDEALIAFILKRLPPADLVRAALACLRWRRAAVLAISRAPPLLGYFVDQRKHRSPQPMGRPELPFVFVPSDASSPRLSLALAPDDGPDLAIHDIHLGLVLLLPEERLLRPILVLDPASRRRALLPPPPLDALPDNTSLVVGTAVLSRAHPSRICFEVVCITVDGGHPCAWAGFVHNDGCVWRALPQSKQAMDQLEPLSLDKRCVHTESTVYWRIHNSGRLLVLDACTLEFAFFIPAAADVGRHFMAEGETEPDLENNLSFPYHICWPPDFLAAPKDDALTENIMNMVHIAFENISYIRNLFGVEYFYDMPMQPTGMKIKKLIPKDEESQRLCEWIDKGVYDALQNKFLRSIIFGVFEERGPLIEEYRLTFSYDEGITIDLWLPGYAESIWRLATNAAECFPSEMWSSAYKMVEKLVSLMGTWDVIPGERILMMKLLYYDDITPPYYEPPFFKSCDGMRTACTQTIQTTLKDTLQDMATLPSDVASVLMNDCCCKDIALGLDSEIPRGYLYCITKKKVTFYFDSGASYHMCGDKTLFQNLHKLPVEDRICVYDADGKKMVLSQYGEVIYEQIKLSPVFFSADLNYNVISLGQLDDGTNLICLGDKRVKIFDVNEGMMIGDGYMHATLNEYIANSITSIKQAQSKKFNQNRTDTGTQTSTSSEEEEVEDVWLIDSLCNNHMTANKKILSDRRPASKTFITPEGESQATQIGTVRTSTVTLFNVYYCKELRSNIISEGQLDRDGYSCTRFKQTVTIQWNETKETVGIGHQDENFLYYAAHCHYVRDPSLKQSKDDAKPTKNLKHSRQDEPSSSTSRKRIK